MKFITFNREELYKELWSKPMTKIAKENNINIYQLTLACDELKIPRPESGDWSKIRNGIKVKQKPLTDFDKEIYTLKISSINETEMVSLLPKNYQSPKVKDQLKNPHSLVSRTYNFLKYKSKEKDFMDDYGRLESVEPGYASVKVSLKSLNRTMCILDAIFKESERQGFKVDTHVKHHGNATFIQVDQAKVYVTIREEGKQNKTKIINPRYRGEEFEYERFTTGKLKMHLYTGPNSCSSWSISDNKNKTLEERLDEFFPVLLRIAQDEKQSRIESEEKERKAKIARKIRKQEEREYRAEMNKRAQLEEQSTIFTTSAYIYQYIQGVETKVNSITLNDDQIERFSEWKKWALEHAERLNPVNQKIVSFLQTDPESNPEPDEF